MASRVWRWTLSHLYQHLFVAAASVAAHTCPGVCFIALPPLTCGSVLCGCGGPSDAADRDSLSLLTLAGRKGWENRR